MDWLTEMTNLHTDGFPQTNRRQIDRQYSQRPASSLSSPNNCEKLDGWLVKRVMDEAITSLIPARLTSDVHVGGKKKTILY